MTTKIKTPKPYHPIRALRRILGQTQTEFAATVGVSKDAVVSWEMGRNPVSASMARRIALVTGADERALMDHALPLLTMSLPRVPFNLEEYKKHRKACWGLTPEESVRRHLRPCADALELLFTAAAQFGPGAETTRLPGVIGAFILWCQETRKDFELEAGIEAQLEQRKGSEVFTRSYGEWRRLAKEQPDTARLFRFKDNPKRGDEEMLPLSLDLVPVWNPGYNMRGTKR